MKTLQKLAVLALFTYGGFMVGYLLSHPIPKPVPAVVVEDKPLTDWNKFYTYLKEDRVYISVGLKPTTDRANHYELFFVDGDEWYHLGWAGLRGCGPVLEVYRNMHTVSEMKRELNHVPSNKAKFVALSPGGKIEVVEVNFYYTDKRGREED